MQPTLPPTAPARLFHRRQRGSVLVVALIFSAIIGLSLVSYIRLGRASLAVSNRALYNNAAMNLAENGMEEAMYSINRMVADASYSWSDDGWKVSGDDALRKWTGVQFDQNATGEVRVYVEYFNPVPPRTPRIISRALVTLGGSGAKEAPIEKWVEVKLARTSKFANGLVAKEKITFSGTNPTVDSWNSDPDNDGLNPIQYKDDPTIKRANGSVGSISVLVDSVVVANADIFGFAATGGSLPKVGPQGRIGPFGIGPGTMDMTRVSTDFTANFDPVAQPTGGAWLGVIGDGTIGVTGTKNVFSGSNIKLSGGPGSALVIKGDVTLYLNAAAGTSAIDVTGNGAITIEKNAKLAIYTAGDIKVAGNGVMNGGTGVATANQPINFQVWGTSAPPSTKQSIELTGNGALSGVVYAPNASVKINGNGDVMGSVVAYDIAISGEARFHYDESLGKFGVGNPYRVSLWNELASAEDRNTESSKLGF